MTAGAVSEPTMAEDRSEAAEAATVAADESELGAVVDIAMPVFRRDTFLTEAIESVLAQTFDRWHLRVCDNGPGGGAIERAVQPYLSDPRVAYSATRVELPVAENWTQAINQGSARYVALLHDDDRWHPEFLVARVEALERHPECGFAFAECVQIDEHGAETSRTPIRFPEGVLSRQVLGQWFARECIALPPAMVVRRSAYEAVGAAFDPTCHYCDWEMWARLAAHFPAYYLARNDSDFRRHPSVYTFAKREDPARLVAMIQGIEERFEREVAGFELSRLARVRNRSRALLVAASDVHRAGGWRASRALYGRALRVYPPTFFAYLSLQLVARTVLRRRLSEHVASGVRFFRRRYGQ